MKNFIALIFVVGLSIAPLVFQNCAAIDFDGTAAAKNTVTTTGTVAPTTISCDSNKITCPNPGPNCSYTNPPTDENGCATGCGAVECEGPVVCPMVACAEPPAGCTYQGPPSEDENGCPTDCGTLSCGEPVICPEFLCSEPPPGCRWVGNDDRDANGCAVGCGDLVCDEDPPKECPAVRCAPPAKGCFYTEKPGTGEDGCPHCGTIKCSPHKPPLCFPPKKCPMIACKAAPGCEYVGKPKYGKDGCMTDCGDLKCDNKPWPPKGPPKDKCPAIGYLCGAPSGCYYDGKAKKDKNGCEIGCGNLICKNKDK